MRVRVRVRVRVGLRVRVRVGVRVGVRGRAPTGPASAHRGALAVGELGGGEAAEEQGFLLEG